ncbi:MAG: DNA polymerase domain-containing protein [Terriglobales bacterium]
MPEPKLRLLGKLPLPPDAQRAELEQDGHRLSLTHLEKPYFPDGIRKRDLLDYSHDVAPLLVAYLRDRPYTMKRFPNGIEGEAFFQKEAGPVPPWMRTVSMPSGNKRSEIHYVLCNDTATLLYLVNLGCVDHNVWMSRAATPLEPDFVLLDLDPGPEAGFARVVAVARILRALLESCEITGCLKTSGATGLHIWIPIAPGHSFEQTQPFAALLLRLAAARAPELVTEIWRVADRPRDRVYLDFRQNAHGKNFPPPYSPRPHPGAPVSCPLQWSELRSSLDPARFNIRTMRRRLDRFGDLFAPALSGPHHPTLASLVRRVERCRRQAA